MLETTMSSEIIVLFVLTALLFSLGFASGPFVTRRFGRPTRR
jgi:hypothetical protein